MNNTALTALTAYNLTHTATGKPRAAWMRSKPPAEAFDAAGWASDGHCLLHADSAYPLPGAVAWYPQIVDAEERATYFKRLKAFAPSPEQINELIAQCPSISGTEPVTALFNARFAPVLRQGRVISTGPLSPCYVLQDDRLIAIVMPTRYDPRDGAPSVDLVDVHGEIKHLKPAEPVEIDARSDAERLADALLILTGKPKAAWNKASNPLQWSAPDSTGHRWATNGHCLLRDDSVRPKGRIAPLHWYDDESELAELVRPRAYRGSLRTGPALSVIENFLSPNELETEEHAASAWVDVAFYPVLAQGVCTASGDHSPIRVTNEQGETIAIVMPLRKKDAIQPPPR